MSLHSLVRGIVSQQNAERLADGAEQELRLMRDGSASEIPWKWVMGLEGRLMVSNFGSGNTALTGATAYAATTPQIDIDVPSGTSIIPIYFSFTNVTAGGTANNHIWAYGPTLVGAGTSTAGTINPVRTDGPIASRCTARYSYTGAGTAPSPLAEIYRLVPTAGLRDTFTPDFLVPIIGPAALVGYNFATTTAQTYYAQVVWIELPSSAII